MAKQSGQWVDETYELAGWKLLKALPDGAKINEVRWNSEFTRLEVDITRPLKDYEVQDRPGGMHTLYGMEGY